MPSSAPLSCVASHRRPPAFSVASLSDLIDTLQSNDELTAAHHEQQRQHQAAAIQQLRALHSLCSELQHRNASLTSDFDTLTAVHRQLQTEYSSVTHTNTALHSDLTQCQQERSDESQRVEAERVQHAAALSEVSQKLVAVTASHQQKNHTLAIATRERDALQRRIAALEDELADSTAEVEQLNSQLRAAEEERDEWVEENTRLESRVKASEAERERAEEAKERVESELQAHLDIAATIHGLSRKAMASREASRSHSCATERNVKSRIVLGELDVNRT